MRGVDLHVARPRVAVSKHPNAGTDSIIGVAREDLGEVSHEAVYDAMRGLTAASHSGASGRGSRGALRAPDREPHHVGGRHPYR